MKSNIKLRYVLVAGFITNVFTVFSVIAEPVGFTTVKDYAIFSALAYESPEVIQKAVKEKGYLLDSVHTISEINMSYYLISNKQRKEQVIAVRGTANVENAIVDASVKLVKDPVAGVPLHEGFSYAAMQVYRDVKPRLKKDFSINTTGHSLGGAVASILSMYLHAENYRNQTTITFGQPKITNVTGANYYSELPILRVVTPHDMVPLVPPFDPTNINDVNIYWHPGTELLLNTDNTYSVLGGIESMMRAIDFSQKVPDEENLANHKMAYYLQLINAKLDNAEEVPFVNKVNPLKWIFN